MDDGRPLTVTIQWHCPQLDSERQPIAGHTLHTDPFALPRLRKAVEKSLTQSVWCALLFISWKHAVAIILTADVVAVVPVDEIDVFRWPIDEPARAVERLLPPRQPATLTEITTDRLAIEWGQPPPATSYVARIHITKPRRLVTGPAFTFARGWLTMSTDLLNDLIEAQGL